MGALQLRILLIYRCAVYLVFCYLFVFYIAHIFMRSPITHLFFWLALQRRNTIFQEKIRTMVCSAATDGATRCFRCLAPSCKRRTKYTARARDWSYPSLKTLCRDHTHKHTTHTYPPRARSHSLATHLRLQPRAKAPPQRSTRGRSDGVQEGAAGRMLIAPRVIRTLVERMRSRSE